MSESALRANPTTSFVIAPNPVPTLPVEGTSEVFPVNRIFCIGRNYAAHAVEMGHDPDKEPPFFFFKHGAAVTTDGTFPYPTHSSDVHHEIEMVVALKQGGTDIAVEDALDHVYGYGVGLDMTRRDLQGEAKKLWSAGSRQPDRAPRSREGRAQGQWRNPAGG
jgi:fumarylpyruvate hydrolase